jgi:hypothetical protein
VFTTKELSYILQFSHIEKFLPSSTKMNIIGLNKYIYVYLE